MIIALFARSNHPHGYSSNGFSAHYDLNEKKWVYDYRPDPHLMNPGGAHGYSVIAVTGIKNVDELPPIIETMMRGCWLPDEGRYLSLKTKDKIGLWYGGSFDFIGSIGGENLNILNNYHQDRRYNSYGDNRFFGIYTAEEVLNAQI